LVLSEIIKNKREEIIRIAQSYGARNLRLFGSLARGEGTGKSDIDLLIDLSPRTSLLDIIAIKQEIEELTGCKVDLVTPASLSPYIRNQVLKDAVPL
jgi:predicted nucleotidyltransferase